MVQPGGFEMSREPWTLKRTAQCKLCPWRKDVDARDIPRYDAGKHRLTERATIARDGNPLTPTNNMACHESHDDYCVGWLMNQIGPGNNIPLRMRMMSCANAGKVRLRGEQHALFKDTIPRNRGKQ